MDRGWRAGWYYGSGFEAKPRKGTTQTHPWPVGEPPPPELLDPTKYVAAMAGVRSARPDDGSSMRLIGGLALVALGVGAFVVARRWKRKR